MIHRASPQDVIAYGSGRALGRQRGAARNRSMQRGSSGGGAAAAAPWTLEWDSDDATYSGSALTGWPVRTGTATVTVDPTYIPTNLGIVANGHTPVTFGPTATENGGRVLTGDSDGFSSITGVTVECVYRAANFTGASNNRGAGDREYIVYDENASMSSTDHCVIAHIANETGGTASFDQKGIYAEGSWKVCDTAITVENGLVVETWKMQSDGTIKLFRNGALIDSSLTWTPETFDFTDLNIGASYGAPFTAPLRGCIYSIRMAGSEVSDAVIIAQQEERITRYAIPTTTWRPTDEASCKGWWDEHGMTLVASSLTLSLWANHTLANHFQQGTAGSRPLLARSGGQLAIDLDGTDDRMVGATASTLITVSAYEVLVGFELDAVSQTTAVGYNAAGLLDSGGFWWIAVRNNGGSYEARVGHWDGAEKSATVTGITLGTRHLLHVWYDGTNINARLDANAPVTPVAAGSCTNLTNQMNVGGRSNTQALNGRVFYVNTFNAELGTSARASARAFATERTGIAT